VFKALGLSHCDEKCESEGILSMGRVDLSEKRERIGLELLKSDGV
jgi:hypothetical protein